MSRWNSPFSACNKKSPLQNRPKSHTPTSLFLRSHKSPRIYAVSYWHVWGYHSAIIYSFLTSYPSAAWSWGFAQKKLTYTSVYELGIVDNLPSTNSFSLLHTLFSKSESNFASLVIPSLSAPWMIGIESQCEVRRLNHPRYKNTTKCPPYNKMGPFCKNRIFQTNHLKPRTGQKPCLKYLVAGNAGNYRCRVNGKRIFLTHRKIPEIIKLPENIVILNHERIASAPITHIVLGTLLNSPNWDFPHFGFFVPFKGTKSNRNVELFRTKYPN